MSGTARLLVFALRALLSLLLVSALWMLLAARYNRLLVSLAAPFLPDSFRLKAVGMNIFIEGFGAGSTMTIGGLMLHWGIVLMVVLILAAVGMGIRSRLKWLALIAISAPLAHVSELILLTYSVTFVARNGMDGDEALRLILSTFAVAWGLLPALAGGIWCFACWLPGEKTGNSKTQGRQLVHNRER